MTDSTPVLTLAIPILGSESERDLRTTLDAAIQLWADSPDIILIQSSQPLPDGFLQDLPANRFDVGRTGYRHLRCDEPAADRCPTARILFLGAGDRPGRTENRSRTLEPSGRR